MSDVFQDYYQILGVAPNADPQQIKQAYREQANIYHPDKLFGKNQSEREEGLRKMKLINEAKEALSPKRKAEYDSLFTNPKERKEEWEDFITQMRKDTTDALQDLQTPVKAELGMKNLFTTMGLGEQAG